MSQILFFVVMVTVWALLHAYVGQRLISAARLPHTLAMAGWGLLVFNFGVTLFASVIRRTDYVPPFEDALHLGAYVGMGIFVLIFAMVVARDIFILGWEIAGWLGVFKETKPTRDDVTVMSRRDLFMRTTSAGIAIAGASGGALGYREARRLPRVERVRVPVEGLDPALEGFRIVQVCDLHVGPTIKRDFLEAVVAQVNELSADLVAVTGDLVDGEVADMAQEVSPIAQMTSRHGTFYVTGNHEYYWDGPGWAQEMGRQGLRVLLNSHEVVEHDGARLVVAGATDYSAARLEPDHASDPERAMEGAPGDAAFRILLAHQPKSIYAAAKAGVDLQLSGHTHGGQFWPWNFVVGLAHPFVAGLHRFEEKLWIYVSRGTGYWGPPLRLGVPAEITVLELEARPAKVS